MKLKPLCEYKYKLRDWIPIDKLSWRDLSENPRAIYLDNYFEKTWHFHLELNTSAIAFLEKQIILEQEHFNNYHKLFYNYELSHQINDCDLSSNTNAIKLLEKYPTYINWQNLSMNTNAIPLLEKNAENIEKIEWVICKNTNAIHIIEKMIEFEPERISWESLSKNPSAFSILKQNPEKIDWYEIVNNPNPSVVNFVFANNKQSNYESRNFYKNPGAITFIEKIVNKNKKINKYVCDDCLDLDLDEFDFNLRIDWPSLSMNPNAIYILEQNMDKIEFYALSYNLNAMYIFDRHRECIMKNEINWKQISKNPDIFIDEYSVDCRHYFHTVVTNELYQNRRIYHLNS